MICSNSNKKIKEIVLLNKKASYRKEKKVFLIEGIKMYEELPEELVVEVYISASFFHKASEKIRKKLDITGYEIVSDEVFAYMSDTKTPQGILVITKQIHISLEEILKGRGLSKHCLFILENLQDPGNLGTILRAGEGAGITGLILSGECVDIYNPKVIRATMGSIFRVPFCYIESIYDTIELLKQYQIQIYATVLEQSLEYDKVCFLGDSAFIIGNEAQGIKKSTLAQVNTKIKIPMLGKVESLNAGIAASILMYELARQRREDAKKR